MIGDEDVDLGPDQPEPEPDLTDDPGVAHPVKDEDSNVEVKQESED
jgi:hypothetical protein